MDDECIICYESTANRTRPCNHAICRSCLDKWFERHSVWCPYCKQTIGSPSSDVVWIQKDDIFADLSNKVHAGVTLTIRGDRIVVTKLTKNDMCHKSGMRTGMIVESINRIPIFTPRDVANILNTVRGYGGTALIRVRQERSPWKRILKRFL